MMSLMHRDSVKSPRGARAIRATGSLALAALALAVPSARAMTPVGAQFQVNVTETGYQVEAAIGVEHEGAFTVVWESDTSAGSDGAGTSIQGRRYASDGTPAGGEFQVNTHTTGDQGAPALAVSPGGDWVVVWESAGSDEDDTDGSSVQGRRYASDGSPVGADFQINSYTTGDQGAPSVSLDPSGDFVVVWESAGSPGDDSSLESILMRRFGSDGSPLGSEQQVNTYTSGEQRSPTVSVRPNGEAVVTWESAGSPGNDGAGTSIQARRFQPGGLGYSAFQVNTYTTGDQTDPVVDSRANGGFFVAWASAGSDGTDGDGTSIRGRAFTQLGSPRDDDAQLNTYVTGDQSRPSIVVGPGRRYAVAWQSAGSDGTDSDGLSVRLRRFDGEGSPLGADFQVNAYTTGAQAAPTVGMDRGLGELVVAWESAGSPGSDASDLSVQAQRLLPPEDGFEPDENLELCDESAPILEVGYLARQTHDFDHKLDVDCLRVVLAKDYLYEVHAIPADQDVTPPGDTVNDVWVQVYDSDGTTCLTGDILVGDHNLFIGPVPDDTKTYYLRMVHTFCKTNTDPCDATFDPDGPYCNDFGPDDDTSYTVHIEPNTGGQGWLSGWLRDENGVGIEGVTITVMDGAGTKFLNTVPGGQGAFAGTVQEGSIQVSASPGGHGDVSASKTCNPNCNVVLVAGSAPCTVVPPGLPAGQSRAVSTFLVMAAPLVGLRVLRLGARRRRARQAG